MLILAAPGTGKTTFVRDHGHPFIDGDTLVEFPKVDAWWRDPQLSQHWHKKHALYITNQLDEHPDATILFSTDPDTMHNALHDVDFRGSKRAHEVVVVTQPPDVIRKRLHGRRQSGLKHTVDSGEAIAQQQQLREAATRYGWRIVEGFDSFIPEKRADDPLRIRGLVIDKLY